MDSVINKDWVISVMHETEKPTNATESYAAANRVQGGILAALIELRETIEEGFTKLDQTQLEAAMMLVGVKESFDGYLQNRLHTDKVREGIMADATSKMAKDEQTEEKAEPEVDKPKKAAVTMDVGNFGGPGIDSGIE